LTFASPLTDPPAFASGVHFYQSDPLLFDAIDGLEKPDKEKHATLLSVEPVRIFFLFIYFLVIEY